MAVPKGKRQDRANHAADGKVSFKGKGSKNLDSKKSSFAEAYRAAAYVLNRAYQKKGHIKTLVYQNKFTNKRHLLYLVVNTLKNKAIIDQVLNSAKIAELKIPNKDLSYSEVITFELLFGRGKIHPLTKANRPFQENRAKFVEALKELKSLDPSLDESRVEVVKTQAFLPKYARVNTLLTTVKDVISLFRKENIGQVHYDRNSVTFEEFLTKVQHVRKNTFVIDYHFPDLLVFNSNQPLFSSNVYTQGFINISDKASCFPVKMLSPRPGSVILDSCAAPGMKTCHLATWIGNEGTILASDRNAKRVETMKKILSFSGVTCCQVSCISFLDINSFEEPYNMAEFALVDPSCSSSGMVGRLTEYLPEAEEEMSETKLRALTRFQVQALTHAMGFPNMKRIAYSTCSINVEENEKVVQAALEYFPNQYEVADTFPEWPERGDESFEFGHKCVRAFPKKHLTNGFFVAILERVEDVPLKMVIPDRVANFQGLKGDKKNKNKRKMETKAVEIVTEQQDNDAVKDSSLQEDENEEDLIDDTKADSSVSSGEIEDIIISKKKSKMNKKIKNVVSDATETVTAYPLPDLKGIKNKNKKGKGLSKKKGKFPSFNVSKI